MSNWTYNSGGKTKYQDKKKFDENYARIFGNKKDKKPEDPPKKPTETL